LVLADKLSPRQNPLVQNDYSPYKILQKIPITESVDGIDCFGSNVEYNVVVEDDDLDLPHDDIHSPIKSTKHGYEYHQDKENILNVVKKCDSQCMHHYPVEKIPPIHNNNKVEEYMAKMVDLLSADNKNIPEKPILKEYTAAFEHDLYTDLNR
jgi:hypothetical protein